jgi:hypothetical protein
MRSAPATCPLIKSSQNGLKFLLNKNLLLPKQEHQQALMAAPDDACATQMPVSLR